MVKCPKTNWKAKGSSLHAPYDWSFDQTLQAYTFQNNQGVQYKVAFTDASVYFSAACPISISSYEIAFEPSQKISRHDSRVSLTIVDIVKTSLQNGNIIIFVCESKDDKQKGRHILFNNWFKKHGEGFKKYDAEMHDGQDCYYLSLMLAPHKYPDAEQHIFSAFQLAINEYHSFKSP